MTNPESRANTLKLIGNSFLLVSGVIAAAGIGAHVFFDESEIRELALELGYTDEQFTYPVRIPTDTETFSYTAEGTSARAKLAWYGFPAVFAAIWLGSKVFSRNHDKK